MRVKIKISHEKWKSQKSKFVLKIAYQFLKYSKYFACSENTLFPVALRNLQKKLDLKISLIYDRKRDKSAFSQRDRFRSERKEGGWIFLSAGADWLRDIFSLRVEFCAVRPYLDKWQEVNTGTRTTLIALPPRDKTAKKRHQKPLDLFISILTRLFNTRSTSKFQHFHV